MRNIVPILPAGRLPDVEIYGGDTTPWVIKLTDGDGKGYLEDDFQDYTFTLTAVPHERNIRTVDIPPAMTVVGELQIATDNTVVVLFMPPAGKTALMKGKYIYQIQASNGTDIHIMQGKLTVRQNIDT